MYKKQSVEVKKDLFRARRESQFKKFDIWEKAVLRGREEDSAEVIRWFNEMLTFTDSIDENTTLHMFPQMPEAIKKY